MPRVSVVIPTLNCARFLGRAIRSVLAQTYADYEILVVDNGSTDETREVLASFENIIRCLYERKRGVAPARNRALSVATGELVAYLDADDMWVPGKLERQVAFLDAHEECGLVHSDTTIIDETDQVIHRRFNRETGRAVPQGHCTLELLRRSHIQLPTVMERRDCLERTGRFDERLCGVEDYYQWMRVAMEGMALGYIDEPLAMYRRRAGSLSSSQWRMCEQTVRLFEIVLAETGLAQRFGPEAVEIVEARLYALHRDLAYLERTQGRPDEARRRLVGLIKDSPLQAELYVDLAKACIPRPLAMRLRTLRELGARS